MNLPLFFNGGVPSYVLGISPIGADVARERLGPMAEGS